MNDLEKYSEVKFMNCSSLGGGMHYLTTERKVLFNMNDLFGLLDIVDDKALVRRWHRKINDLELEHNIPTMRNYNSCGETYVTLDGVITILNIYAKELIDKINVKNSVDFLICDILNEVEKTDMMSVTEGTLSTQFALEAIKLDSRISKGANDALIYILESNKNMLSDYNHQPWFDVEELKQYDEYVEKIYEIMDSIQSEIPVIEESSQFSLMIDDCPDDSMFLD